MANEEPTTPNPEEKKSQVSPAEAEKGSGPRRWKILGMLLTLIIALAGVSALGLMEKWRTRQAIKMVQGTKEMFEAGQQQQAFLRIESAWRMRPNEPQVIRAMCYVLEVSNNPQSLELYEKLAASGDMSAADRQRYVLAAVRFRKSELADRQAQILAQSGDVGYLHLVKAEQFRLQGQTEGEEKELRAVAADSAAADNALLRLASNLASRGPSATEARAEAVSIFGRLSSRDDTLGLSALTAGLASGAVPAGEVSVWAGRLANHPQANDNSFLIAQAARWPNDKEGRRAIVKDIMTRFSDAPVARKLTALLWLNDHQEFARSLDLVSDEQARSNPGAFVLYLDALAGRGDWTAVDIALSKDVPLKGGVLVELFRARAANRVGRADMARQSYERACQMALTDPEQMPTLVNFFQADGKSDTLIELLKQALDGQDKANAEAALLRISQHSKSAEELHETWYAIARSQPDNSAAAHKADYYAMITGAAPPSTPVARGQITANDIDLCSLRALALLKEGKEKEAVALFEGMSVTSDKITPQQKVVVVCVLAANGRMDQAKAMAGTLDPTILTKQEVQMVEEHLKR
ncbi:MAG: hypothetical protein WCI38_07325 [Chthoniobacterales bacterium]